MSLDHVRVNGIQMHGQGNEVKEARMEICQAGIQVNLYAL